MFGSYPFGSVNDTLDPADKAFRDEFLSGSFDDEIDATDDADYWNDNYDDEDE